jgi:hypothetical protein
VSVLPKAFFPFVSSDFVSFSFLTARHNDNDLNVVIVTDPSHKWQGLLPGSTLQLMLTTPQAQRTSPTLNISNMIMLTSVRFSAEKYFRTKGRKVAPMSLIVQFYCLKLRG